MHESSEARSKSSKLKSRQSLRQYKFQTEVVSQVQATYTAIFDPQSPLKMSILALFCQANVTFGQVNLNFTQFYEMLPNT